MECKKIDIVATGKNIDRLRIERGMAVTTLEEELLVSKQAVYKWIRGYNLPSIDTLVMMAKLFDVRIDDIIICKGGDSKCQ